MQDILIIGHGPAGISAALYAVRSGLRVTAIGGENSALKKAHEIENYYGFAEPISGEKLMKDGMAQALRMGVNLVQDEVVGIGYGEGYIVKTRKGEYEAKALIFATGTSRAVPKIPGLKELEGRGVSYCAVCDGFFFRGKDVAVIGAGEYALHEAMELLPIVGSVTLLTDSVVPTFEIPEGMKLETKPIAEIEGEDVVEGIAFEDGSTLAVAGVFVAIGVAGSDALAKKIGAISDGKRIIVDENMATNLPGLFAAGDCTGGMLQIAKAVYEGAKAGAEAVKHIRNPKAGR